MGKFFTKSFFKFTAGFITIVAVSLLVIIVANYYDDRVKDDASLTNPTVQ